MNPHAAVHVSVESEVANAFAVARNAFGQVEILVNNAGIQPLGVKLDDLTGPILERTFAVNVNGVAFGLKHAGRSLAVGGRVILTGVIVGVTGGAMLLDNSHTTVLKGGSTIDRSVEPGAPPQGSPGPGAQPQAFLLPILRGTF